MFSLFKVQPGNVEDMREGLGVLGISSGCTDRRLLVFKRGRNS